MADVTGPISSLPGSRHPCPPGATCDDHPDRPAAGRVQGETDSFGSEMHDLCAECIAAIGSHAQADREGCCDWCRNLAKDLKPHRDFEEGMCGRVYRVCGDCRTKEQERLADELDDMDY